ncbi:MAG TPA: DUF1801 domain-containing protein [Acidobacteriaceae bacterium]|nr:DUF1801 domain-containing protein [Acidobacteriaceae bacterium]
MQRIRTTTVDEYISMQPEAMQIMLERVRGAIGKAVPDAEECISYQIPAFKLDGRALLYFAGFKEHYSVYPASDAMVAAFPGELDRYRASKGTLRFSLTEKVPVKLIERIAKFRADEVRARKPAKAAAKKKRKA